jgi:hypothetical protein
VTKQMTVGLIIGNRGFFPDHFAFPVPGLESGSVGATGRSPVLCQTVRFIRRAGHGSPLQFLYDQLFRPLRTNLYRL